MSDEQNQDISIEFLLRQIDQALAAKDIEVAKKLVTDAKGRVQPGMPEHPNVQRQERELQALHSERIALLEDAVRGLLIQTPVPCDALERELDELQCLQPGDTWLEAWRNTLARERRKQRSELQLKTMEAELNRVWQEAEEAQQKGLSGVVLIDLYRHAWELAASEASKMDLPVALALAAKARDRYEQVRKIHGVLQTRQMAGEFRQVLADLRQLDPGAHVWISEDLMRDMESQRYIVVTDAIKIVERQARDYAAEKASQYRDRAREHMERHAPGAAEQELRRALELSGLDEQEAMTTRLLLTAQIQPALEARRAATTKLQDVEVQGDPQKAWELLMAAHAIDPYTPGLEDVKRAVVARVKTYLDERLMQAQQRLESSYAPDFEGVLHIAGAARGLAAQDIEFEAQFQRADALLIEAEAWKRLDVEIKAAINDAEAKKETQPRVAYEGLLARMSGWGERSKRFKALSDTIAALEARVNVGDLITRATLVLQDTSIAISEEALRACDVAIKENQPRQGEVIAVRRRLDLHLKYLQGATLLRNSARTSADEQSGLKLLQEVLDGKGDDLTEAQELTSTVKRDRQAEEAAAAALALGARRLQEKRYEDAYAALKPYAARAEFAEPLEQAAAAWEAQLLKQVQEALAASRIDEVQARRWVEALEGLGSAQASQLRACVIGRSAAQRARDLELLPNKKWADILAAWDEAVAAEPTNAEYQAARQSADKQKAYSEMSAFSLENQVAELDELAERYPVDLEVRLRLIDTLVKHIDALRSLDEVERNVIRAQALITRTEQLASENDAARKVQAQLAEQAKTVQVALEIAQRKNEVEQQLRPDRLLDSWKHAKVQVDELLRDYPTRRDLMVWARAVRGEALRWAQDRLREKTTAGGDVWETVIPAAQVLILNEDNMEARQQIESVYQAIISLEGKQMALEGDKVGAAYPGDGRQALAQHLADASNLRRKLMLAEQVLMLFGDFFRDPEGLRNHVNALQARNRQLIDQLDQLQRYLAGMEGALFSARTDDSENAWYRLDEQRNLIENLGYGRHCAVLAMDEVKRQVQEKQRYLRDLRARITQAVQAGNTAEALRLAELMRRPGDPMADPTDDYGEQCRFRVQEPYTRRSLTRLDDLVALLQAQLEQVVRLREWLPVNQPLVRWAEVAPAVDEVLRRGLSDAARRLIDEALDGQTGDNGNPSGKLGEKLALYAAIDRMSRPVVGESQLNSAEARRLWDYGRQLVKELLADRDAALVRRGDVDRLENEWQDAWSRLMGAMDMLEHAQSRPLLLRLRPGWKADVALLRRTVRMEYDTCASFCPDHPDLVGLSHRLMALAPVETEQVQPPSGASRGFTQTRGSTRRWRVIAVVAIMCLGLGVLVAMMATLLRAPEGFLIAMGLVIIGAALYLAGLLRSSTG